MRIRNIQLENFLIFSFLILLVQNIVLNYSTGWLHNIINYFDELFVLGLLLYALCINEFKIYLDKNLKKCFAFIFFFSAFGLASSLIYEYQNIFLALVDWFVCIKFFLVYFSICQISVKYDFEKHFLHKACKICELFAIIVTPLSIISLFYPLFGQTDVRYGLYSVNLFYGHPSNFAACCILCSAVLMANYNFTKKIYIFMLLLCAACTLRTKALASAICIIFIYLYFIRFKIKNKFIAIIGIACLAVYIGYDQLMFYYGQSFLKDDNFIRAILTVRANELAASHFPLGTGFATFGSNIAAEHFSPLYNMLGIKYGPFLSDTFWPTVIAQTGYIGTIFFAFVICFLIQKILLSFKNNIYCFWACASIMIYEIICSLAEPAFFHPQSSLMFLVFGIVINFADKDKLHSL